MVLTSTPQEKAELMEQSAVKGRSLWDDARTRLLRNKAAVASLIVLGFLSSWP
jgi:oligopeptide transport system permease protein